jgi:hypothetical protein
MNDTEKQDPGLSTLQSSQEHSTTFLLQCPSGSLIFLVRRRNTLDEELGSRSRSFSLIKQMGSSHDQRTSADQVPDIAEHQSALSRVVGNAAEVLQVLCVSKEYSSNYLVADASAEIFDTSSSKGSALAIPSSNNLGRRALCAGKVEKTDHFSDGC